MTGSRAPWRRRCTGPGSPTHPRKLDPPGRGRACARRRCEVSAQAPVAEDHRRGRVAQQPERLDAGCRGPGREPGGRRRRAGAGQAGRGTSPRRTTGEMPSRTRSSGSPCESTVARAPGPWAKKTSTRQSARASRRARWSRASGSWLCSLATSGVVADAWRARPPTTRRTCERGRGRRWRAAAEPRGGSAGSAPTAGRRGSPQTSRHGAVPHARARCRRGSPSRSSSVETIP